MQVRRFVTTIWHSNSWLLTQPQESTCYLVDCGDYLPLIRVIENEKLQPVAVFLTHIHFDHIGGLNKIMQRYPNLHIFTCEYGKAGLFSDQLNLSRYTNSPFIFAYPDSLKIIGEGMRIPLWKGTEMSVYETPGHNPSCLTFVTSGYIFTGDSYIPGLKVVTNLPDCEKDFAEQSFHRIIQLADSCDILPGHGDPGRI